MYDKLRGDLKDLVDKWEPALEIITEDVRTLEDKNTRLAHLVELNRFKDLLTIMKTLHEDQDALFKYTRKIASIRSELYINSEYENVGTDIIKLIESIENFQLDSSNIHQVRINIKRCIRLLKRAKGVLPSKTMDDLIDRINKCIIKRNKVQDHPQHGIILNLCEERGDFEFGFITQTLAQINVKCNECEHVFEASGNPALDIFAPVECPQCRSKDISRAKNKACLSSDTGTVRPEPITKCAKNEPYKARKCLIQ
jgi:hypothetical protein